MIDRYFASFVCGTYLLFTAILSINIFIGLISNALQTEAFSTVEARFLLERIEVILNYEWRLSDKNRLQLQEMIHRQCAPLQLNWKDINFNAYGQSREEQQTKAFASFRQTLDKHNVQFDTFRTHVQQKLADIDANLAKRPTAPPTPTTGAVPDIVVQKAQGDGSSNSSSKRPSINMSNEQLNLPQTSAIPTIVEPKSGDQLMVLDELTRLRELLEETLVAQTERMPSTGRLLPGSIGGTIANRVPTTGLGVSAQQPIQQSDRPTTIVPDGAYPANLNERMTDLQLAVNRLHQDVGAIRQVLERLSPLSTSLLLGRAASRR